MRLRAKLNLSVMALAAVFLSASAFSLVTVARNAEQTRTYARMRETSQFTSDLRTLIYQQLAAARDGPAGDGAWLGGAVDDVEVQRRLSQTDRERQLWDDVRASLVELGGAMTDDRRSEATGLAVQSAERSLGAARHYYDLAQFDSIATTGQSSLAAQAAVWAACALTVLGLLAYSIVLRSWLVRPIHVLKRSADIFGRGDLSHRVPLRGNSELAELGRTLDDMAAGLASHQAALVEARRLSAIGELCAHVAHGLRNPIAAMRAAVQLAEKRGDASDTTRAALRELAGQASRMDQRISKLFEYSRPVALRPEPVRFADLAATIEAQVRCLVKSKGVGLAIEDRTGAAQWLLDREQCVEALAELVSNAIHHTPAGGVPVVLRAQRLAPVNGSGDGLQIEVIDRGAGMARATLEKAFDLFFTSRPEGTGMGLALVRRVVERHGGTIGIESAPREGTTVTVTVREAESGARERIQPRACEGYPRSNHRDPTRPEKIPDPFFGRSPKATG